MGDHLKIDLALIRATGEGLVRIKDALQNADATKPAKELTKQSSPRGARDAS